MVHCIGAPGRSLPVCWRIGVRARRRVTVSGDACRLCCKATAKRSRCCGAVYLPHSTTYTAVTLRVASFSNAPLCTCLSRSLHTRIFALFSLLLCDLVLQATGDSHYALFAAFLKTATRQVMDWDGGLGYALRGLMNEVRRWAAVLLAAAGGARMLPALF